MTESIAPRTQFGQTRQLKILVGLFAFGFLGVMLFPACGCRGKQSAQRSSCQSNLRQIMLAIRQYSADYDAKFPILATSDAKFGWAGALQPYVKATPVFQCPSEACGPATHPAQSGYTDYWFNARLAGIKEEPLVNQALIEDPALTIALGDGNTGTDMTDARYHLAELPNGWRQNPKSPL